MKALTGLNSTYGYTPTSLNGVFCTHLKYQLKLAVKGEVKCYINNDTLFVTIYATNDIVYQYTHKNITSEIVHGLSSETCTHLIVKRYRHYITNLFFM